MQNGPRNGLRAVALFEAGKGVVVLVAGLGLLSLLDHDEQHVAIQLVTWLHLNPNGEYPRVFIDLAASASNPRLWLMCTLAVMYAAVRFVEAYGLWWGRRWAEWFAAASFGVYIPVELYELLLGVSWVKVLVLAINAGIVGYLCHALWVSKRNPAFTGAA